MNAYNKLAIPDNIEGSTEASCSIRKFPRDPSTSNHWAQSTNCFRLIWLFRGTGVHWIDLEKADIRNDLFVCLRPGQVYRFESGTGIEGYAITIGAAFIAQLDREVNSLPLIVLLEIISQARGVSLASRMIPMIQELLNQMELVLLSTELVKLEILNCYIEILIKYLSHQLDYAAEPATRTRYVELVESFLSLVEKNFIVERRVGEYASRLAITPGHLNEVVKKTTGHSAGHLIRRRVGLEARRKALHTTMGMKEVAYSLGFDDPAHFSKFFKNTTGLNFSEFRRDRISLPLPALNTTD